MSDTAILIHVAYVLITVGIVLFTRYRLMAYRKRTETCCHTEKLDKAIRSNEIAHKRMERRLDRATQSNRSDRSLTQKGQVIRDEA